MHNVDIQWALIYNIQWALIYTQQFFVFANFVVDIADGPQDTPFLVQS